MSESTTPAKSGIVSIVGRPNTGKSTLLNRIVGEKIAIVSKIPQTTRNQIRGMYNDERGQIVFIDTPGFHFETDNLDRFMNSAVTSTIDGVDCLIYLVDPTRRLGTEEENIAAKVKDAKVPIILGLNKIDMKSSRPDVYIEFFEKVMGKPVQEMENVALVALSGERGTNVDKLVDVIFEFLPEGPPLYDPDTITDLPQKIAVADIIREKFIHKLRQELPHAIGVFIEQLRPIKGGTMYVKALVYVETSSQKEIVIGKNGQILKAVGSAARAELEQLFDQKVFLEFFVKSNKHWRDDIAILQELGYDQSMLG
ncbi:MAG: GTPase Era [Candidatus Omnitrophica bacterium]|nr:GTPase Era [Candidatus Omnitrophota bacterium]